MTHKGHSVGVALLCIAFGSEALTLGGIRGAALVGQSLNMVVPVQMDAGDDASSLCFDAEVFHADTRQDASRVRVVVEALAQPNTANVRILSSAIIDEPVVTIYLRTGCGQKITRRYVLLADLPNEAAVLSSAPSFLPVSVPSPAQVVAAPVSASLSSVVSNFAPVVPASAVKTKTVRQGVSSKRPEVKAVVASPEPMQAGEKSKTGRPAGRARLTLDPLELISDRVANLDSDMTVSPPDDALRSMQKMQALEENVRVLLASAAKSEASLVDLRARLQKAESERFPAGLIYGLIAIVLACLAAVALLWSRQRRVHVGGDDWWSGSIAVPASAPAEPDPDPSPEPDVGQVQMREVDFNDFMPSRVAHGAMPSVSSLAVASPSFVPQASEESGLSYGLDLDLSDSQVRTRTAHSLSAAAAAVDVPLPMLGDHEFDVQDADTRRLVDLGNLMEFDLPESPQPPVLAK